MAYSLEVVHKARKRLADAKEERASVNREHLQLAYQQVPRLRELDMLLRNSMAMAAQAVFTQGGDARAAMEEVKKANLTLQAERENLVQQLPKGFLDETPLCAKCGGSGYMGAAMCDCLERLCRAEQAKKLARLTTGQETFDAFRLDYYPE